MSNHRDALLACDPNSPGALRDQRAHSPDCSPEIAQSWARSRAAGLEPGAATDGLTVGEVDPGSGLMAAARPVLEMLEVKLAGTDHCTLLADQNCRIVYRWFDDPRVGKTFDDTGAHAGASFLEEKVGTNGLGTALELRRGVAVNGVEHFADSLKRFSCYGQPIRHPLTNRIEGVLDFTAVAEHTNPLLSALMADAVADIQQRLLDGTRASERYLLAAFQSATSRRRHAIVALGENVVLSNRAALDLLDPADYATLGVLSGQGRDGTDFVTQVPLTNGTNTLIKAGPVPGASGGAIFEIEALPEASARASGSGQTTHTATHLPLLIAGAAGTGRTRTAMQSASRHPVMIVEPALAVLEGERGWARQFREMTTRAGTVVVEGIDLLPDVLLHLAIDAIGREPRPDFIVTACPVEDLAGLAHALASSCVRSVQLAPLAMRPHMIGDLAAGMLRDVAPHAKLRLTPGVITALSGQRWPGNFHELKAVMAYVATHRSAGDIVVTDLPPQYRSTPTRKLWGLQRAERDAIVAALESHDWNKLQAAKSLGVSRTTLYSRMRTLSITG